MAEKFLIRPLEPTRPDSEGARLLVLQDLLSMGMPEAEALEEANPESEADIQKQTERTRTDATKQRLALFTLGQPDVMLGLLVTGEWTLGDELQYIDPEVIEKMSPFQRALLKFRQRSVIGTYELLANRDADGVLQIEALVDLLSLVVDRADAEQKRIKSSFYEGDPATPFLHASGFQEVPDRIGIPVGKTVKQKLILRNPQVREGLQDFVDSQDL